MANPLSFINGRPAVDIQGISIHENTRREKSNNMWMLFRSAGMKIFLNILKIARISKIKNTSINFNQKYEKDCCIHPILN